MPCPPLYPHLEKKSAKQYFKASNNWKGNYHFRWGGEGFTKNFWHSHILTCASSLFRSSSSISSLSPNISAFWKGISVPQMRGCFFTGRSRNEFWVGYSFIYPIPLRRQESCHRTQCKIEFICMYNIVYQSQHVNKSLKVGSVTDALVLLESLKLAVSLVPQNYLAN